MPLMWDESLSVNQAMLDAQHRRLIDVINQLDVAMSVGKGQVVLVDVLNRLVAYAKTHFADEEKFMEEIGHSYLARHRKEHQDLVAKVVEYRRRMQAGEVGLALQVARFLQQWLVAHILASDKAYAVEARNRAA